MSQRSILLLGAGPLQVPAIQAARRMGLRTVVMDFSPGAPGLALADAPRVADIKDAAAALAIARAESVSGVASVCTDYGVRTVAAVSSALGLPGVSPEAALRATDKHLMREAFRAGRAPTPRSRRATSEAELRAAAEDIGFPAIVKPTDGVGSKGVTRADSAGDLAAAWARAQAISRSGCVVCEEYVDGPEVSVEGLTWNGETRLVAITDKITSGAPFFVETGHTEVSRLPAADQERILDAARRGVAALGINFAASHTEIRLGPAGPSIMEIGARLGGDRITSDLVPLATGVDLFEATLRVALGEAPDVAPGRAAGAAIRYFLPAPGVVESIDGEAESRAVEGVVDWVLGVGVGGTVPPLENSLTRVGHVVTRGASADEAAERAERAASRLRVRTR